ncbi:MAG: DNA translocase FtsK 4TM domain-containing protein [Clostridia bacterium]
MSNGKRKINGGSRNTKAGDAKDRKPAGQVKVRDDSKRKEIAAVILIASGIFMFFSLIDKTGIVGRFLINIFYGLFGRAVTVAIMITMFVLAWCLLRGTEKLVFNFKTTLLYIAFVLFLASLIHTLANNYTADYANLSFTETIDKLWHSHSGGIIGGGISCILQKFFEKAGALVILVPSLLIVAITLFSFSIVNFARKSAGRFRIAGNWFRDVKKRFAEQKAENKTEPQRKSVKKPLKTDFDEIPAADTESVLKSSFEDMNEPEFANMDLDGDEYHMDFEFETTANKKRKPGTAGKTGQNGEIRREEDTEVIKTILPGMNNTLETKVPEPAAEDLVKVTTSKFDTTYDAPPFSLLETEEEPENLHAEQKKQAAKTARKLEEVMRSFGIEARVIHISRGSTVTRYELQPHSGVKVSRIKNLSDDIALNLAAPGIRIEAPIPGKAAIGIEIPNEEVQTVYLRDLVETEVFLNHKSGLSFCLGEDISGETIVADIAKMPHLLIAGSTGSGKSVCINCMITSILYKASPDDVRMIMIDPKVVELGVYNGIPHLLIPVVTEPKKAAAALAWAVQEMENRYKLFAKFGIRDINSYNHYAYERGMDKMPRILVIIDELADLMMVARDSVEEAINRIAQKARAAGIHLVVATQRPSVDVITGLIKSNIPSRIAFKVASQVDSRTILDYAGAEKLLGRGDMLFYPVGSMKSIRAQGGFISDEEIENVVKYLQTTYGNAEYDQKVHEEVENARIPEKGRRGSAQSASGGADGDVDELFLDAVQIAIDVKQISASYLQRKLGLGYSRASRIIDQMEEKGYISGRDGNNPRQVLISSLPETSGE